MGREERKARAPGDFGEPSGRSIVDWKGFIYLERVKKCFLHRFLNSIQLIDDFGFGNSMCLADPSDALGDGKVSPAHLSAFPTRP